jgi:hypothetical protein
MLAAPRLTPFTCGRTAGVVWPAAMETLDVTTTLDVSLLASVTFKPPAGAATGNVSENVAD